jgi:hypothetical protein
VTKQAKAQPVKLDGSTDREGGTSKKSKKAHELVEASQTDPTLCADLLAEIKEAQSITDKAKAKRELVTVDMFQLCANLLSVNEKYAWNKIVEKQTACDPYTNLQG